MEPIREKLRSEDGASILLALLFFLLCAMVGASVLMAAASNAGKSRGGREEQQKYLTLSSAMRMVCDELTAAEYTAKYQVETIVKPIYEYDVEKQENVYKGNRYEHTYEPTGGEMNGWGFGGSPCVLPLVEELDKAFANTGRKGRQDVYAVGVDSHSHFYWTLPNEENPRTVLPHTITLKITPDDDTWLTETVEVTAQLDADAPYSVNLAAKLVKDGDYTMFATLILDGDGPQMKESGNTNGGIVTERCGAVRWKLSQITREEPT